MLLSHFATHSYLICQCINYVNAYVSNYGCDFSIGIWFVEVCQFFCVNGFIWNLGECSGSVVERQTPE